MHRPIIVFHFSLSGVTFSSYGGLEGISEKTLSEDMLRDHLLWDEAKGCRAPGYPWRGNQVVPRIKLRVRVFSST